LVAYFLSVPTEPIDQKKLNFKKRKSLIWAPYGRYLGTIWAQRRFELKSRRKKRAAYLQLFDFITKIMVGRAGFEPATNWLKANCSTN
jgi:hypothetical protein